MRVTAAVTPISAANFGKLLHRGEARFVNFVVFVPDQRQAKRYQF